MSHQGSTPWLEREQRWSTSAHARAFVHGIRRVADITSLKCLSAADTPQAPGGGVSEGAGSGFVIGDDGVILTNNHVVAGASRITVGFYAREDEEYTARVIGRDPLTDSALLRELVPELRGGTITRGRIGVQVSPDKGDELSAAVSRTKPGTSVPVEVVRGGNRQRFTVTVAALDSDPERQEQESGSERRFGVALGDVTPDIERGGVYRSERT
jgi:S1-C subfamily serine protease